MRHWNEGFGLVIVGVSHSNKDGAVDGLPLWTAHSRSRLSAGAEARTSRAPTLSGPGRHTLRAYYDIALG